MVVVAVVVVVFSVAKRKDTIPSSARDKHVVVEAIAILAVLVLGLCAALIVYSRAMASIKAARASEQQGVTTTSASYTRTSIISTSTTTPGHPTSPPTPPSFHQPLSSGASSQGCLAAVVVALSLAVSSSSSHTALSWWPRCRRYRSMLQQPHHISC